MEVRFELRHCLLDPGSYSPQSGWFIGENSEAASDANVCANRFLASRLSTTSLGYWSSMVICGIRRTKNRDFLDRAENG